MSEKKKLDRISLSTVDLRPTDEVTDQVMETVQLSELERLGRATERLGPSDDFLSAVMAKVESARDPLDGFAERTADLRVADAFTDSVMAAVAQRSSVFPDGMMKTARPSILFASVAAAACVLLSWYTERSVEVDTMSNLDMIEVSE